MEKILDGDFRKDLYKSLMEAGYDKNEAQCIVGKQYYIALRNDVLSKIGKISEMVKNDAVEQEIKFDDVSAEIREMVNLKKILQPKTE